LPPLFDFAGALLALLRVVLVREPPLLTSERLLPVAPRLERALEPDVLFRLVDL